MAARADPDLSPAGHAISAKRAFAQAEKSYPRARRPPTDAVGRGARCCGPWRRRRVCGGGTGKEAASASTRRSGRCESPLRLQVSM
ncbi:hypothetical protein GLE_0059 [Lysobacter enzymogenes]|uniref:Uncharacterized protein n=1 Tax=Lysobacter enzymogenes TaxID=69 RepID=A0A0S2DA55_LYSEN|nr:hypothetical protein GLE_0059 [Lysobacter enzymogenes]